MAKSSGGGFASPFIAKLTKAELNENETARASYMGVFKKCLYFMGMTLIGAIIACIMHKLPFDGYKDEIFSINYGESVVAGICFIAIIVTSLVAAFVMSSVPVTGAICCASIGYLIAFCGNVCTPYKGIILVAAVLTFVVVGVLQAIYATKKIRSMGLFRTIITVTLAASLIGGLVLWILYLIPATRGVYLIFTAPWILILCSVGGVFLASCFLLTDFETVRVTVENGLPEQYEWFAAYSLSMSVLWLYLKILELIVRIAAASSKKKK